MKNKIVFIHSLNNFTGSPNVLSIIIKGFVSKGYNNFSDLLKPIRQQGVNHQGIKIGKNCWIGAKVTILDGVVIGNGCIIAAGSVVTAGEYEDNKIYGGVPAKFLKNRT
jgi:acetyltransferase-like isoleucine patch superfamily enzyme